MGLELDSSTRVPVAPPVPVVQAGPGLREIFDAHAAFVGRTLRYMGVRDGDLEDACQEVFLVVHSRLSEFEGRATVRTWIRQICVRVALAARRKHASRREQLGESVDELEAPGHVPASRSEARDTLNALLDTLDEDQRMVFVLYEIEDLDMKEVAAALGCPLQTAYSRHRAARARLERAATDLRLGGSQ